MSLKGFSNWAPNQSLWTNVDPCQRAWMEVNSQAIETNASVLKDFIGDRCHLMAVVKADGYGHGAETVARAALCGGANNLGVATLQEGIQLRKAGLNCPVLVLGNLTNVNDLDACLYWKLIPTLSGIREALLCQNLAEGTGKKFEVHIKVDTGMSRLGCDLKDGLDLFNAINSLENLLLKGVYSHLALADSDMNLENGSVTALQHKRFEELISSLPQINKSICFHLANSAGTIRDSRFHYNMVRVGLALYGHSPISNNDVALKLQPAMSIKARVTLIREVDTGTGVGYGHSFITKRPTRLAVVAIGYADGVSRALSGKISVLCNGKFSPQVGSIAMDQLVVDITDQPDVKVGSIITLLGEDGSQSIRPQQWSNLCSSIPWEILCGFKNRLPRIVV
tara:strand:+ start:7528 stop:8712 length:1185 start_codon:yes stop_codon:yes gene_type:complete